LKPRFERRTTPKNKTKEKKNAGRRKGVRKAERCQEPKTAIPQVDRRVESSVACVHRTQHVAGAGPVIDFLPPHESSAFDKRLGKRGRPMKTNDVRSDDDDLRPEYDLSKLKGGVRGKYLHRFRAGTNLALLAPDIRAAFPTDESVNQALRSLMQSTHPA
jgi:hypothetical protein